MPLVALLLAVAGVALVVLMLRSAPPGTVFAPDRERWLMLATAQAATFEAGSGQRVAVPPGTPTATRTPISPRPTSPATVALSRASPTTVARPAVSPAASTPEGSASPVAAEGTPTAAASPALPTSTATSTPRASTPTATTAVAFRATHQLASELPVNLRAAPGTSAAVVALLAPGTRLAATGEESAVAGEIWLRFSLADGQVGWILATFAAPLGP